MSLRLEERGDGVLLPVRAAPGASRDRIVGVHDGALKVAVTAAPEKGKANDRILAVLAKALGIPRRSLALIAGSTSRDKMVRISGFTAAALHDRLGALLTSRR